MSDLDDAHLTLADSLSEVGAAAVRQGLVLASGGNLSARVPGAEQFIVTGRGTWLDRLGPESFALVDLDGNVLSGPTPSSEWKLHQRTYRVRPDVNSVVHLHPQMSVLLTAMDLPIRLMTLDHAHYVRSYGSTPYYPNGSDELADSAAEQAREHNCVVMGHHGCSTVGENIEMAFRRAMSLEQAAMTTYWALTLGDKTTSFPADELRRITHA